ncbi:uncharacterized protein [Montipora foliosa]|uniref:uncharacterized protein n=1 Tax=Montipora foliosa TaxID=591990 RepID=UPI0035F140B7
MEDKRKGQQNPQRTESTFEAVTSEETTTLCECLEETVVDTEERENEGKRQRTDYGHCGGDDGEGNDSGTVTLHIPEDDNSPRCSNAEYIHAATGLVTSKWNIICNVQPMARTKT